MRTLLLFLHIVAAGAWLGASLSQVVFTPRFRGAAPQAEATYLLGTVDLERRLYTPAAIVLLVTGIVMVIGSEGFSFSDVFVSLGFLTVIVGAILAMVVFGPKGREAAGLLSDGKVDEARSLQGRLKMFGIIDTLLVLVTILAMVAKWGVG